MNSIQSRLPRQAYDAIDAISITRLKELRRSPQHYKYLLDNPKSSTALTLGLAAHTATLEPERFLKDFAVWDHHTDTGRMAPRNGRWWELFKAEHPNTTILTEDEARTATEIALAVRGHLIAITYLAEGDPEATLRWDLDDEGRPCKGRVDWLTKTDGVATLVGLKTARDCRHFVFGAQAAKLGYHIQWAFYHDGYKLITGTAPMMIEIVVENTPPYAVGVYNIPSDIIEQGRDEYFRLLALLGECERNDEWPGPQEGIEDLTLPSWAYERDEDVSQLGLEW
jgi:hypothetical protein